MKFVSRNLRLGYTWMIHAVSGTSHISPVVEPIFLLNVFYLLSWTDGSELKYIKPEN